MPEALTFPRVPDEAAIRAIERRGGSFVPTGPWYELWEDAHQTAFTVAQSAGFDILKDIYEALHTAMADGIPFGQFKRDLTPILQKKGWWGKTEDDRQLGSPWRLKTIFNQNLRVSSAQGDWERQQSVKDLLPYLRYTALLDGRTRPLHASWHGTILPIDHPWWNTHYPPNGWNCRCKTLSVDESDLELYGWKLSENAPDDGEREWLNRSTGQTELVPNGIDPGWAYNPGRTDHAAHTAKLAMDRLIELPPRMGAKAVVALALSFPLVQRELKSWISGVAARVKAGRFHALGERRVVGAFSDDVISFIQDKDKEHLASAAICLGDRDILHFLRSSKEKQLPTELWERLPELLLNAEHIYWDNVEPGVVYALNLEGLAGKIIVFVNYETKIGRQKRTVNNVRTGRVLRDLSEFIDDVRYTRIK